MNINIKKTYPTLILSFFYVLIAFCYPPFKLSLLVFVAWVPLLWFTRNMTPKQAFWSHLFASIPHNAIAYYWIYHVFGVIPNNFLILGFLLFILLMSLYSSFMGYLFARVQHHKYATLLFPTLWAGFEVFRTSGQMSFPWSHIGYTLGSYLPMIQITSWVGVFGLSFLIILTNVLIFNALKTKRKLFLWGTTIPLLIFLHGTLILNLGDPKHQESSVNIHLVQPSLTQEEKWEDSNFYANIHRTFDLTKSIDLQKGDIIVWPESAIPYYLRSRQDIKKMLNSWAKKYQVHLIVGALQFERTSDFKNYQFYNSLFLFDSLHNGKQYSKVKLVPFSEKLPFDDIFPVLNYVNLGEGDFTPGKKPTVWYQTNTSNQKSYGYGLSICYEIIYPQFIRSLKQQGAQFVINATNDGWFKTSPAVYQHASISKFRAVELRLPIARVANTGFTLFFDSYGRTLTQTQLYDQTVLSHSISLHSKKTLYTYIGNWVENGFLYFLIGFMLFPWSRRLYQFLLSKKNLIQKN